MKSRYLFECFLVLWILISGLSAEAPPTIPGMTLDNLKDLKPTGHILTITNRAEEYQVTVRNGVHMTNFIRSLHDEYYEKVELCLAPGGQLVWRQVRH